MEALLLNAAVAKAQDYLTGLEARAIDWAFESAVDWICELKTEVLVFVDDIP